MRSLHSEKSISRARFSVSAVSSMSHGLTLSVSPISDSAPANSLNTSTPSPSSRQATYSLATRFSPSRTGATKGHICQPVQRTKLLLGY